MFSTSGNALFNTFYMAMGSYDDQYSAMAGSGYGGRASARFLIMLFIFLVVLLMLNIFLAIMVDAYADVKDDLHNEDNVPSVLDSSLERMGGMWEGGRRAAQGSCRWVRAQAQAQTNMNAAGGQQRIGRHRQHRHGMDSSMGMASPLLDVEMANVDGDGDGDGEWRWRWRWRWRWGELALRAVWFGSSPRFR